MRPFLKSIIFVFYFTSISVFASSIDFFYTLPPNDNPNGKGPRPNLIREIDAAKKTLEGSFFKLVILKLRMRLFELKNEEFQ